MTDNLTQDLANYCRTKLGAMRSVKELPPALPYGSGSSAACLYVVTSHLNQRQVKGRGFNNKYMKCIQAGAALTEERICGIDDNSGDNISRLNPYYCEITAGYWIAKHDTHRYVGLCHYSRWLDVCDSDIERIVGNDVDVVLPTPIVLRAEMVLILRNYGDMLEMAVLKVNKDYQNALERHYSSKILIPGNICIARREIFVQYYEWMYAVLQEMETLLKDRYGEIPKRLLGYMAEHLTNIYFLKHKECRIVYAPLIKLF